MRLLINILLVPAFKMLCGLNTRLLRIHELSGREIRSFHRPQLLVAFQNLIHYTSSTPRHYLDVKNVPNPNSSSSI
jgi:hypothetical protein